MGRSSPATILYLVITLSVLNNTGMRGSKILLSLYALEQGATAWTVGVLAAMYAVFPLMLAVHAGKLSDRIGNRPPILWGSVTMAIGLALPFFSSHVASLVLSAALVGLGHIYFHVAIHNLIGSFGDKEARTKNFSTFALGVSIAAFAGPLITGFAIDTVGYRWGALIITLFSVIPLAMMLINGALIPAHAHSAESKEEKSAFDLFAIPGLRRAMILGGITLTGIELLSFYFPVYGRAIGLSASAIGIVLSSQAVAAFIVRLFLHRLARRFTEIGVLTAALFIGAIIYFAMPFTTSLSMLMVLAFILGLGLGTAQPLSIILTYNNAPQGRSGEALGLRLMINKLIQVIVPLVFGGMGAAMGVAPVFWACAAFLLGGGAISVRDLRNPLPVKPAEANAPVTTPKTKVP